MLYVSVKWSRLQGLNFSRSAGVIGRTEDMIVVGAKGHLETCEARKSSVLLDGVVIRTPHSDGHPVASPPAAPCPTLTLLAID